MNPRAPLAPLTPLYRLGLALRERRLATGREPIRRLRLPVISIGNLSTGGTGKTPLVIALALALRARGIAVDVLSRGYGRSSPSPARVDPAGSADDFGDEPLLIARSAGRPVYVAPQRYDAGLLAESELAASGPALHLLDDAFQHRQLHRDLDILLLTRADLTDRLLPAGNLREPLSAMRRAHVIAIPADDRALESDLRARGWQGPVWRIRRRMEIPALAGPVLAFCGIARPAQFFAGLESAGVRIAIRRTFPDHHRYTQSDLDRLASQARAAGATALLTTEKDAVRIEGLRTPMPIRAAPLVTELADEAGALDWLAGRLAQFSRSTTQT
jgi:tetraacyldisaccharide 4'-kinase